MNVMQIELQRIWKDERLPRQVIEPEEQKKLEESLKKRVELWG